LAIARPALKFSWLTPDDNHPKTAFAIIIDNSYSMDFLIDTNTALDKAKEHLKEINSKISEDDITLLLTLDPSWNQLFGNLNYGKIPPDYPGKISITPNPLPLKEVIKMAESTLAQSDLLNREIIILSDLQTRDLPSSIATNTFFIPVHQQKDLPNISLQNSRFSYNLIAREKQNVISFDLQNHAKFAQTDLVCRLFLDGNSVAEKVVSLQPHQNLTSQFQLNLNQSGWHRGFVEVINERLPYDNKNYFAFYHDPEPQLAVISTDNKLPVSLKSIAEIYAAEYEIIADFQLEQLQDFSAIIVYDPPPFSAKAKFTLQKLGEEQGVLFIAAASLSNAWQNYLGEKFNLTFSEYYNQPGQDIRLNSRQDFHPITSDIELQNSSALNDFWQVKSTENILLQAEKFPIILAQEKSLLWTFDPASLINPFLLEAAFPIIAYRSLNFVEPESKYHAYQTGDLIKLNSKVTLPDNSLLEKSTFTATKPGIYQTENLSLAINIPYEESDYQPIDYQGEINFLTSEDWPDKIIASRYGYEIWKYLLLLVIILFLLEMLIVKSSERKAR